MSQILRYKTGSTVPTPITHITFLACRAHYPGGPERVHSSVTPPFHAAFP